MSFLQSKQAKELAEYEADKKRNELGDCETGKIIAVQEKQDEINRHKQEKKDIQAHNNQLMYVFFFN